MATHYKIHLNDSETNDYCFMPSLNASTLGDINQTLLYPQTEPPARALGLTIQLLMVLFGIISNGLIAFVIVTKKNLQSEGIAPAILSLVGSNFVFCINGLAYSLSPDSQWRCKVFGMIGYGLMLCSAYNLFGTGVLRFLKLYFTSKINEKNFRSACIIAALLSWIVPSIVLMPTAVGNWGQIAVECNSRSCQLNNVNGDGSNTGYSLAQIYFISYIVIGISNILLNIATYYKIQESFRAIRTSELRNLNSVWAADLLKKERKVAIMMGADSILYVIFPMPRALLYFIDPYPDTTAYGISRVLFTLWGSTAIIEPILLLIFKAQYRTEIKKIFKLAHLSVKNTLSTALPTSVVSENN